MHRAGGRAARSKGRCRRRRRTPLDDRRFQDITRPGGRGRAARRDPDARAAQRDRHVARRELDLQALVQTVTDAATELSGAASAPSSTTSPSEDGDAFLLYTLSGAPREAFEQLRPAARNRRCSGRRSAARRRSASTTCSPDPRYGKMGAASRHAAGHLPVRSYLAVPVSLAVRRSHRRPLLRASRTRASSPSAPSGWSWASPRRPRSRSTTPGSTKRRSGPPRSARRCSRASARRAPRPSA